VIFDRIRNDLQKYGRRVYQLQNPDCLYVVLYNQQSDHAGKKQAGLKLLLDLSCEIIMQLGFIECLFEIIDGWQWIREVLKQTEHLWSTKPHKLAIEVTLDLTRPFLFVKRGNEGGYPSAKCRLQVAMQFFEARSVKLILDKHNLFVYLLQNDLWKGIIKVVLGPIEVRKDVRQLPQLG
jgi:hypothetical protein